MGEVVATIVLVVIAWLVYLLPAMLGFFPLWYFGQSRAQFRWWELSILIVPFVIWICFLFSSRDKSLGNIVEALLLGGATPIAALIRVLIGGHLKRSLVAASLISLQSIFAVLLGTMFPEVSFHWFH